MFFCISGSGSADSPWRNDAHVNVSLLNEVMRRFLRQQSHIMDGTARGRDQKKPHLSAQLNGCFMLIIVCPVGSSGLEAPPLTNLLCASRTHWRKRAHAADSERFVSRARASHCVCIAPDRRFTKSICANPCWYYNLVNAHPKHKGLHLIKSRRALALALTRTHNIYSAQPHQNQTHALVYICGVHAL